MTKSKQPQSKPVSPRPVGRPPKQETLDYLREKGERETLKLCADLRSKIARGAQLISTKMESTESMADITRGQGVLNQSGETAAKMSAILRKAKVGEAEGGSGGTSAEELLKSLEKEMG